MIAWSDDFTTGDARIDQQHRQLFEFFNDLEVIISERRTQGQMADAMRFLERYIQFHFGFEEECMARCNCPFAEQNKQAHQAFREAFLVFKNQMDAPDHGEKAMRELHKYLEDWIRSHILGIDTHLLDAVKSAEGTA
jgi:hemerythrin